MPLKKGYSKKTIDKNFHELKQAHPDWSMERIRAAVLSTADESAQKAGKSSKAPKGKKKKP